MFTFIVNHFMGSIPTWVWPFVAGGGFGCYFLLGVLGHFPQFKLYTNIGRPVAFIVFVIGVFFYGSAGVLAIQQQALVEANHKVELAEQATKDANLQLQTVLDNQKNLVKGRSYGVHVIIEKDASKIDADCRRINDDAWEDYNRAVKNSGSKILTGDKK